MKLLFCSGHLLERRQASDQFWLVRQPVHPFDRFAEEEFDGLSMFEDTRLLARALFPRIGSITAATEHDSAAMLRVLSATGLS